MTHRQQNKTINHEKVKSFFQKKSWEKGLTFSFFLLIAFGFWLMQYLQQKFEIEVDIPIYYKNIPPGTILNDSLPKDLKLKISDRGTILLNYTVSKKIDPITINLKNLRTTDKTSYTISQAYLEKEITRRIMPSTTLLSYTPNTFTVAFHLQGKKEMPVSVDGTISLATGYMLVDTLHVDPSHITVFGSSEILDTLQAIYTDPVDIKELNKTFEKEVKLTFPKGITSDQKIVVISGDVEGYTEKTVAVPVTCINLPPDYIIRLFPSTVEIACNVALSKYRSLDKDSFQVQVDYNQLVQRKKISASIEVSIKPKWLKSYRISPENVEFLIEKKTGI